MTKKKVLIISAVLAALVAVVVLLLNPLGATHSKASLEGQVWFASTTSAANHYPPEARASGLVDVTKVSFDQFLTRIASHTVTSAEWAVVNRKERAVAAAVITSGVPAILVADFPKTATPDQVFAAVAATGVPIKSASPAPWFTSSDTASSSSSSGVDMSSPWVVFGFPILLLAVMLLAIRFMSRRSDPAMAGFTDAPTAVSDVPVARFTDVAGVDEAVEEMSEVVDMLRFPQKYAAVGARIPRGVILSGPPGTGKTLLARAVAGEAGVAFYASAGADFSEMYVGVGAARVRSLFNKAREHEGGAIVFIDEVDTLGRARSNSTVDGSASEQEAALNALLTELDGFDQSSKVMVIAATNRPDLLDDALLRPGRLERRIEVGLPDRRGRENILKVHVAARGAQLASDASLGHISRRTAGMSGAELERVVNESVLACARFGTTEVTAADLDQAVATVVMGKERTSVMVSASDRRITAYHEAGHTVAALTLPDASDPVSVSIVPRGNAGGVTWMSSAESQYTSRKRAHAQLVVALAGRAGEECVLDGEFTSGPHGDLQSATQLAYAMVTSYGMTDSSLLSRGANMAMEQVLALDMEVKAATETLLLDALVAARALLDEHQLLLVAVAEALLDADTLSTETLIQLREKFVPVGV